MKTFVLDHSLSFSFRQGSTGIWTRASQTHHNFGGTSLNYSACYLFFSHHNTTKHAFTGIHLPPFQSPKSFMTSHCQWKAFTEKYCKHVLLIKNHHHDDRQHISLCILFGWTPCMRTAKLAVLSSPRRWMLQRGSTTSLAHKTNEKTSKSPLFQTEVISQLVELAWSIYTQSYTSGHPVKTA